MIKFIKASGKYRVEIDGAYRGHVKRVEDWTTRGDRIRWEAVSRGGIYKGSAATRNDAAMFLKPEGQPE